MILPRLFTSNNRKRPEGKTTASTVLDCELQTSLSYTILHSNLFNSVANTDLKIDQWLKINANLCYCSWYKYKTITNLVLFKHVIS